MVTTVEKLESGLKAILDTAANGSSANLLNVEDVRRGTAEFRREIDEDQLAHGLPLGEPDWNLLMNDADRTEPAVFVVTIFRGDEVTFAAGRGRSEAIIQMCNRFSLAEPDSLEVSLKSAFSFQEKSLTVGRALAQAWLGV